MLGISGCGRCRARRRSRFNLVALVALGAGLFVAPLGGTANAAVRCTYDAATKTALVRPDRRGGLGDDRPPAGRDHHRERRRPAVRPP